jgi:hypothetical protein
MPQAIAPADSIKVSIPNLKEYVYSFRIVAHDNSGGTSVGQDLNNVRVYGPVYQSTLLEPCLRYRHPYTLKPDGSVDLNFLKADTGNVSTIVEYSTNSKRRQNGYAGGKKQRGQPTRF